MLRIVNISIGTARSKRFAKVNSIRPILKNDCATRIIAEAIKRMLPKIVPKKYCLLIWKIPPVRPTENAIISKTPTIQKNTFVPSIKPYP